MTDQFPDPTKMVVSSAAQAVWHAYETADCDPYEIDPRRAGLAAALRAAADQVDWSWEPAEQLLSLAAELDNTPATH